MFRSVNKTVPRISKKHTANLTRHVLETPLLTFSIGEVASMLGVTVDILKLFGIDIASLTV